jgi:hypothetical protein
LKNPLLKKEKKSAFRRMSADIESRDVFLFMGLCLLGVGLYCWFGCGPAFAGVGLVLLIFGVFGK